MVEQFRTDNPRANLPVQRQDLNKIIRQTTENTKDRLKLLTIPIDEKLYIYPDVRKKLFVNMLGEYKERYPKLKLIYAALNWNAEVPIDYVIIFSALGKHNVPLILFDIPYQYSDHTTPGYRYCLREDLLDTFFKETTSSMVTMFESRFWAYINHLDLSPTKGTPFYWLDAKNQTTLHKGLLELSLMNRRTK